LRQSAADWHEELKKKLLSLNFRICDFDPCLFTRQVGTQFIVIGDFVDDMGIGITPNHPDNDLFFQQFNASLPIKVAEMSLFLGMRITRDRKSRTISINQAHVVDKMVHTFELTPDPAIVTPMLPDLVLPAVTTPKKKKKNKNKNKSSATVDLPSAVVDTYIQPTPELRELATKYRQLLGGLLFITNHSRPDCSYAVGYLARFAHAPLQVHWDALVRVLHYLANTRSLGLTFRATDTTLRGYVDATWVGKRGTDPLSRSTTGFCFFLGGALVSWKSSVQKRPALSSTDAEIIAASEGAREAMWLRGLLSELRAEQKEPTVLFEDNKGVEETVHNGYLKEALKHVELRDRFVLWAKEKGLVRLVHVSSKDQIADCLTKPLGKNLFSPMTSALLSP